MRSERPRGSCGLKKAHLSRHPLGFLGQPCFRAAFGLVMLGDRLPSSGRGWLCRRHLKSSLGASPPCGRLETLERLQSRLWGRGRGKGAWLLSSCTSGQWGQHGARQPQPSGEVASALARPSGHQPPAFGSECPEREEKGRCLKMPSMGIQEELRGQRLLMTSRHPTCPAPRTVLEKTRR